MTMQNDEQKELMKAFDRFVKSNKLSLASVARELNISQNTISNWRKGMSISIRNQNMLQRLMSGKMNARTCAIRSCTCRDKQSPLMVSLLELLGAMSEIELAKVYAYTLEIYGQNEHPQQIDFLEAAETRGSFNSAEILKKKNKD